MRTWFSVVVQGIIVNRFSNPMEAYRAAQTAYQETGIFHEVREVVEE